MSEDVILFSRNLMFVRKLIRITQSRLAEKLGIKPNTISNYQKEVTAPDFKILVKLCKLVCLPTDTMLNTLLTQGDLESKPDWLLNVRQNFNLNDLDAPLIALESISPVDPGHIYNKQLLEILERKEETIMELNRRIGRLELQLELLQKENKPEG